MKKISGAVLKRVLSLSWAAAMLLGLTTASSAISQPALAVHQAMAALSSTPVELSKDETVYASLNFDGSIRNLSVVNHIRTPNEGIYTDYGHYTEIMNLSSGAENRQVDGTKVTWQLPASDEGFYYEGILKESQLPFIFSIVYSLDGKQVDARDLIGQSGKIKIEIKITSNTMSNPYYVDNYLAQVQLPLSLDKCSNILAAGAQSVIVGSTNTLAFMVMPGVSKEYSVTFDAKDFEMDGITTTVTSVDVQSLIGIDTQDIKLNSTDISQGTGELVSGTEQLKAGVSQLADGLKKLASGTSALIMGSSEFQKGLKAYTDGLVAISDNAGQISQGINQLGKNGGELSAGYTQISEGTVKLMEGLLAGLPPEQQSAYSQQVEMLKQQLQGYGTNLEAYTKGVSQSAQGLSALSEGLSAAAQKGPELNKGAAEINTGLVKLGNGLNALYDGARLIPDEIQKLIDGQKELKEGLDEALSLLDDFNLEGNPLPEPVSFADSSKTVDSVQFVIKTPELKPEPVIAPPAEVRKEQSFWEKLAALFVGKDNG